MLAKKINLRQFSEELVCFLIVLLFMYASVSKLFEYQKFHGQISQSPLLTAFSGFVVWFIPSIEIVISLLLVFPKFRRIGLLCAFCLMVLFTAYIIAILNFTAYIPCSCGGVLSNMGWSEHFIFNSVFVVLCAYGSIIHEWNLKNQTQLNMETSTNVS
jgi:uncharacterized membrane protein YphA (DoxX/SURF4 family)